MNIIYLILFYFSLIYLLMQVSPRKKELFNLSGHINPLTFNSFDYMWILNTSCGNCFVKVSCQRLSLFNYHSIIFSSQTNPIFQDATFKNYSSCPDTFYSSTDRKGFYFVYYYRHYYSNFQDIFNFSYLVFNCTNNYNYLNHEIFEVCNYSWPSQSNKLYGFLNKANIFWKQMQQKPDCLFCSRYMHAMATVDLSIYVHGGFSSRDIHDRLFIRYKEDKWEKIIPRSKIQPPCLYGHSMDYDSIKKDLVVFGGIVCGSSSINESSGTVWIYHLDTSEWTHHNVSRNVIGHSIHINQDIMYLFYGLNSSVHSMSVLPTVQKYNLSSRSWLKEVSLSPDIKNHGSFYHSTYRHESKVWIYGGLYIDDTHGVYVSNVLYIFDMSTDQWEFISQYGPQIYLHTSVIINNTFMVFGGVLVNTDSTNQSQITMSKHIYLFDLKLNRWFVHDKNFTDLGGKSVLRYNSTVWVIGRKDSLRQSITKINILQSNFKEEVPKHRPRYIPNILGSLESDNCSQLNCESCVSNMCSWCSLTRSCISRTQLNILHIIGACESPILYENQCPIACEYMSNSGCKNCTKLQFCGWCEFQNSFVGVGKCVEGTVYGPLSGTTNSKVRKYCMNDTSRRNWSFLDSRCPDCNCNGHGVCNNTQKIFSNASVSKCISCSHNTTGDQCQYCKHGFHGSATNGNKCHPCKCLLEHSAGQCHPNGFCDDFCIEKGRIGKYCNECDTQNNFTKFYGMCVFKCKINLKYRLNEKTDFFNGYVNRVRFLLSDIIYDIDLGFKIRCINSQTAIVKVQLFNNSGDGRILIPETNCGYFDKIFPKGLFHEKFSYQLLFTVEGFQNSSSTQFQLEVTFTQKPYTNIPFIFISLFAFVFTALLLFYTVFKMRQHRRRNHNYHTMLVMERPFVKVHLKMISSIDVKPNLSESSAFLDTSNQTDVHQVTNIHQCPLICVEPYFAKDLKKSGSSDEVKKNIMTTVVTFLFQSPKCTTLGTHHESQEQHSSQILIGSTLTKLTKQNRKTLLELPTKSTSGNHLMVERDFDTSISPSAAEELLITEF